MVRVSRSTKNSNKVLHSRKAASDTHLGLERNQLEAEQPLAGFFQMIQAGPSKFNILKTVFPPKLEWYSYKFEGTSPLSFGEGWGGVSIPKFIPTLPNFTYLVLKTHPSACGRLRALMNVLKCRIIALKAQEASLYILGTELVKVNTNYYYFTWIRKLYKKGGRPKSC